MSLVNLHHSLCSGKLLSVHPLPSNHDALSPLLSQHFPPHSRPARLRAGLREGETAGDGYDAVFDKLQTERRWRALADLTADQLLIKRGNAMSADARAIQALLRLWVIRLSCLRRLHLYSILASESGALFALLPPFYSTATTGADPEEGFFSLLIPFELVQCWAVMPMYLGGDRFLVLKRLREIMQGCKREYWRSKDEVWTRRVREIALVLANVLVDLQEYAQAATILNALAEDKKDAQALECTYLLHLELGNMTRAKELLKQLQLLLDSGKQATRLEALLHMASGEWSEAESVARLASEGEKKDIQSINNLAVSCLYTGKIAEGIDILESLSRASSAEYYNEETCISNIITLQELQCGDQFANKLDLLREASKYASEGLGAQCLRLD